MEHRTKFKGKPIRVIEFELKQKGIDREIIDEVLSRFDERKSLDEQNARKLAEKKIDFYRSLPPEKRREKVMSYLLRKGFSYDTVKKILKYV
ncbi:RecX family transcriptional regulator [Candidatus Nomurabacteria bacterium]|nr:RecX family transcriptional regulator [Candidatus Nomurabacteria bacterium]